MIFGQLTNRDSLRDLIVAIDSHSRKTYHLSFGKSITRSILAKANESRNSNIFGEFACHLIDVSRRKRTSDNFEIKNKSLCLLLFFYRSLPECVLLGQIPESKRKNKTPNTYDITTQIPAFINITAASVNDFNAMNVIVYETGAYYIFDCGYVDYTTS